ncbi:DMT family transporter [Formicincola oecophyllae]|uniref:DMT family transporter n=1 Tax=Formicincola oecophyllae TaxID=2558361 RepID=A0A4Y6U697_9PROT|nr:DMT family transporter [Formicincola oecophyllae]QDH12873.1 DMT family transporter [Formicincola oecophyllae]
MAQNRSSLPTSPPPPQPNSPAATPDASHETTMGTLLALGAFAAFSISDLYSKFLAGHLNAFEVAASSGLFGLPLLFILKKPGQSWRALFPEGRQWLVWCLRALAVFISTALSVEAFMLLPMAEAMALMFLCPFATNVLATLFLHDRIKLRSWMATLVGFVGVLMILRPGVRAIGLGELCALAVAFVLALNVVTFRAGGGKAESPLTKFSATVFGPLVGNGLLCLPDFKLPHGAAVWGDLFGYGFLMAVGQLGIMAASRLIPSNRISLAQYSQMLWTVGFSLFIFHDRLDSWTVAGIVVILLSGLLEGVGRRRPLPVLPPVATVPGAPAPTVLEEGWDPSPTPEGTNQADLTPPN